VYSYCFCNRGSGLVRFAPEPTEVQRMSTLGLNVEFRDSKQFREIIITDHQKYGTIIREAGIQPD